MKEKIKKLKEKITRFCSDKQRVYAAILAVLMIFWTIGSLLGIISFFSSKTKKTGLTVLAAAADEPMTVAEEATGDPELNAIYDDLIYGSSNGTNFFNPSAADGYYSSSGVIAPYGSKGVPYGFKVYSFDDTFTGGNVAVTYGGIGVLGSITRSGYYTLSFDAGDETDSVYFRFYACDDSGTIKVLSLRNGDSFYISDEFLTHSAYLNTARLSFGVYHDTGFSVGSTRIAAIQVTEGLETYEYSPYFYFDNVSIYETGYFYAHDLGYDEGYEDGIDEGYETENTGIFHDGTMDVVFLHANGRKISREVTNIDYSDSLLNAGDGYINFFNLLSCAENVIGSSLVSYDGVKIFYHLASEQRIEDICVAVTSYGVMTDTSFFDRDFYVYDAEGYSVRCLWRKIELDGFDFYRLNYYDEMLDLNGSPIDGVDTDSFLVKTFEFVFTDLPNNYDVSNQHNDCHLGLYDENVTNYVNEVQRYYEDGKYLGHSEGFNAGSALSNEEAYNHGYNDGFADGSLENGPDYNDGYDTGYAFGYNVGSVEGYNSGLATGIEKHNDYTFMGLIGSAFDVPLNAFRSMFNFEVLGVNLQSFFFALLTCCVLLAVVKLIL